ncbi:MAG: hypothetical protein NVS3B25_07340 [Hymenobacter sp.]
MSLDTLKIPTLAVLVITVATLLVDYNVTGGFSTISYVVGYGALVLFAGVAAYAFYNSVTKE